MFCIIIGFHITFLLGFCMLVFLSFFFFFFFGKKLIILFSRVSLAFLIITFISNIDWTQQQTPPIEIWFCTSFEYGSGLPALPLPLQYTILLSMFFTVTSQVSLVEACNSPVGGILSMMWSTRVCFPVRWIYLIISFVWDDLS